MRCDPTRTKRPANADVLIYGRLTAATKSVTLQPEIFVNLRKVRDAEELLGEHPLADAIPGNGPLDDPETRRKIRDSLATRTEALANFVLGLSEYANSRFDASLAYFRTSANQWPSGDRRDVLYLFLGNASLRNHQIPQAEGFFDAALNDNPGYARALVGRAEARFLNIAAANCAPGRTDLDALRALLAEYTAIPMAADQPPQSSIPAKTAFGIGRASVCLSLASGEDHFGEARRQFEAVIADYSSGNTRAQALAAESPIPPLHPLVFLRPCRY